MDQLFLLFLTVIFLLALVIHDVNDGLEFSLIYQENGFESQGCILLGTEPLLFNDDANQIVEVDLSRDDGLALIEDVKALARDILEALRGHQNYVAGFSDLVLQV